MQIADTNLDLIVKEINEGNPKAYAKYRQVANYLFGQDGANLASIKPIVDSLQWLERNGSVRVPLVKPIASSRRPV